MTLIYETLLACPDPRPVPVACRCPAALGELAGDRAGAGPGPGGMRGKGLSHGGGGQAALRIPHRHRALSGPRRRRSRIEGKPAALPVSSAGASKACCLCNTSAKERFIGNASLLSLSAVQRSVATRMRVWGDKVSIPPTFFSIKHTSGYFLVIDSEHVKIFVCLELRVYKEELPS